MATRAVFQRECVCHHVAALIAAEPIPANTLKERGISSDYRGGSEVEAAGHGMSPFPEAAAVLLSWKTIRRAAAGAREERLNVPPEWCRNTPWSMQTTFSRPRTQRGAT